MMRVMTLMNELNNPCIHSIHNVWFYCIFLRLRINIFLKPYFEKSIGPTLSSACSPHCIVHRNSSRKEKNEEYIIILHKVFPACKTLPVQSITYYYYLCQHFTESVEITKKNLFKNI